MADKGGRGESTNTSKRAKGKRVAKSVRFLQQWIDDGTKRGNTHDAAWSKHLLALCNSYAMIAGRKNARYCAASTLRLMRQRGARSGRSFKSKASALSDRQHRALAAAGNRAADRAIRSSGVEEVTDHPVLRLLYNPEFGLRGQDFHRFGFLAREVVGNSFVLVSYEGSTDGLPTFLHQLHPAHVSLIRDADGVPSQYEYEQANSRRIQYDVKDILHHKFEASLTDKYWGLSPLQSVLKEVQAYEASTDSELSLFSNLGIPPGMIDLGEDATDEEVQRVAAQFEERTSGVRNRGKPFVVNGAKYSPLGFPPKEMEYIRGREDLRTAIFAAYDIPESMIELNDANVASSRTGDLQYKRQAIKPRLDQAAEEWTETLLPLFNLDPDEYWFVYDNPVEEDKELVRNRNVSYVGSGIKTINEARQEEGLAPIEGGDVPRVNGVPLDRLDKEGNAAWGDTGDMKTVPTIGTVRTPAPEAEPKPEAAPTEAGLPAESVADAALNGAQLASIKEVVTDVANGAIPLETGRGLIRLAVPSINDAQLNEILAPLANFKPRVSGAAPVADPPAAPAPEKAVQLPAPESDTSSPLLDKPEGEKALFNSGAEGAMKSHALCAELAERARNWRTRTKAYDFDTARPWGAPASGFRYSPAVGFRTKALGDDKAEPLVTALKASVEDWYKGLGESVNVSAESVEIPDSAVEDLRKRLRDGIAPVFQEGGKAGIDRLAESPKGQAALAANPVSFEVVPERALKYLDDYAVRLSQQISKSEEESLLNVLRTGLEEGQTIPDIKQGIKSALSEVSDSKAEIIARTETANAYVQGNLSAWKEAGVARKRWMLARDHCTQCEGFAARFNESHDIDKPFLKVGETYKDSLGGEHQIGFRDVDGAPLHPGCRCDVEPIFEGE